MLIDAVIKFLDKEKKQEIIPGTDMVALEKNSVLSIDYIEMKPGSEEHTIIHRKTNEMIFITEGAVLSKIGGKEVTLRKGDYVAIPCGTKHMFMNNTNKLVGLISVCTPPYDENDVFNDAECDIR
ncbi:MAG: cupin domain-containing protein [Rhodospirillales bacterium]|nr:cupin domain-containing protein [Rhodospirillales bacterium]